MTVIHLTLVAISLAACVTAHAAISLTGIHVSDLKHRYSTDDPVTDLDYNFTLRATDFDSELGLGLLDESRLIFGQEGQPVFSLKSGELIHATQEKAVGLVSNDTKGRQGGLVPRGKGIAVQAKPCDEILSMSLCIQSSVNGDATIIHYTSQTLTKLCRF